MIRFIVLLLLSTALFPIVRAEEYYDDVDDFQENNNNNYDDWNYNYNDDAANAGDDVADAEDDAADAGDDDAAADEEEADDDNNQDDGNNFSASAYSGDDYIQYWTDYAILPQRCIVYNDVDVIVFSVFSNGRHMCADSAVGTYTATVPKFMQGFLKQKEQDMGDQGYEYEEPEVAQYAYCTPFEIQNQYYYFQIGCDDGDNQALAVNIYEDDACTIRSSVDGVDDSNIDVSEITPTFDKCRMCVNWYDRNDDQAQVDDGFYEYRMQNAPLCATAWQHKEICGRKCKRTGVEKSSREGWSSSERISLGILGAFSLAMLLLITKMRMNMSNKDSLLEQASLGAAGLQQPHVIGMFLLIVIVIAIFALLGLKNITWTLLLLMNLALFAYLMKLTLQSYAAAGKTIIGPDGQILNNDSDDSSVESVTKEDNAGTYSLPVLS